MRMPRFRIAVVLFGAACMMLAGCSASSEPSSEHADHDHAESQDEPTVETVTGQLSGFDCAVVGVLCPTTHRGADYTTGVFTDDKSFYFVVNIPQSFLQQHFRETVEGEGTVYAPYERAVEPELIHVIEEDERRKVYEEGYFIDEEGRRATFQDGEFRDGKWVVP